MRASGGIEVRTVADRSTRRDWLRVPTRVLCGDPVWVPPLLLVERQRIDPAHNPFFADGEAAFFVAYRDGAAVGRISAQLNRRHLQLHNDATGHFGFFDCIDDDAVAAALVAAAAGWLSAHGMTRMVGPFNLTVNQEAGLLVAGFELRPAIMTPHAPPWAGRLLEARGFSKVVDLFAYRMSPAQTPSRILRLARLARESGRVRVRNIDMRRYRDEARLIFDIFNDAWSDNWGFVPFSPAEGAAAAADLRPLMRAKFGLVAEIEGEPAAMLVVLPDLNEVIAPFGGRLLPANWARLAHAIWRDDWRTARVPLLGIRRRHRNTPLAAGVLSLLVAELLELGRQYRLDWVEFSWVLEGNRAMTAIAELAAGKPAKVYRLYGRDVSG